MPEYKIEERFVDDFEKKVNKLISLCRKYNLDFTFKDLGSSYELKSKAYVKYHNYLIEDPVDDTGWKLLARINHTDSGNIVEKVGSEDIPRHYYYDEGKCDHCHTNRNRKYTYIIKSEDGEYKQVGVQCSKEYVCKYFFEWTACWFRYLEDMDELARESFNDDDGYGGGPVFTRYYSVRDIIAHAIDIINRFGYDKESGLTREKVYESIKDDENIDPSYFTLADKIIDWVLTLDESKSDYIHNMQVYFKEKYVPKKALALIISVVPYYRGCMNRAEKSKKSTHKYEVGDRVTIKVKDFKVVSAISTVYGIMCIYKFIDEEENVYIWKTGNSIDSDVNYVKGTVKACSEYNGEKQTELTRCKIS